GMRVEKFQLAEIGGHSGQRQRRRDRESPFPSGGWCPHVIGGVGAQREHEVVADPLELSTGIAGQSLADRHGVGLEYLASPWVDVKRWRADVGDQLRGGAQSDRAVGGPHYRCPQVSRAAGLRKILPDSVIH